MNSAFQSNAFQNDAFQIEAGTPPVVDTTDTHDGYYERAEIAEEKIQAEVARYRKNRDSLRAAILSAFGSDEVVAAVTPYAADDAPITAEAKFDYDAMLRDVRAIELIALHIARQRAQLDAQEEDDVEAVLLS